ncbi:MAG: hypothetical protein R3B72_28025 [Polyangiaceae bacterium]
MRSFTSSTANPPNESPCGASVNAVHRGTLPSEARSKCGEIFVATDDQVVVCRYAITEPGPDGWSVAAFEPHVFSVPELSRLAP